MKLADQIVTVGLTAGETNNLFSHVLMFDYKAMIGFNYKLNTFNLLNTFAGFLINFWFQNLFLFILHLSFFNFAKKNIL